MAETMPDAGMLARARKTYDPRDHYWVNEAGAIFSSAKQSLIPSTDEAYLAWTAAGNKPTAWPRDDAGVQTTHALHAVLAPHGLSATFQNSIALALAEIVAKIDAVSVHRHYPAAEAASFAQQSIEARLVTEGKELPEPSLLKAMVAKAGSAEVTLQSVAADILSKVQVHNERVVAVRALRQDAQTRLGAATDVRQIREIATKLRAEIDTWAETLG